MYTLSMINNTGNTFYRTVHEFFRFSEDSGESADYQNIGLM